MLIEFSIIERNSLEYAKVVALREEILRKPLGIGFSPGEIAAEKEHIHIACFLDGVLVATCVLVPEKGYIMKMQRVAVCQEKQRQGIGSRMMDYAETLAKSQGIKEIYVSARAAEGMDAVPFYLKHGYRCEDELYNEDGIPHQRMTKKIEGNGL